MLHIYIYIYDISSLRVNDLRMYDTLISKLVSEYFPAGRPNAVQNNGFLHFEVRNTAVCEGFLYLLFPFEHPLIVFSTPDYKQ